MLPDRKRAEEELVWAGEQNPGIWVDHSRYVAMACEHIASRCGLTTNTPTWRGFSMTWAGFRAGYRNAT